MAKKLSGKLQRYSGFVRLIRFILYGFKKRPFMINDQQDLIEPALFLSNHSGASGPMTICMFFEKPLIPWGAYPMCGNYRERWHYLYYIFYRQKLKYGKFKAMVISTLFAILSKGLYNGVYLIATYPDIRFKSTIDISIDYLNQGNSILIFPEDSSDGYLDKISTYQAGFVYAAMKFYEINQKDLPIYSVHYSKKLNLIHISPPEYIQSLVKSGLSKKEIADYFRKKANDLASYDEEKYQVE